MLVPHKSVSSGDVEWELIDLVKVALFYLPSLQAVQKSKWLILQDFLFVFCRTMESNLGQGCPNLLCHKFSSLSAVLLTLQKSKVSLSFDWVVDRRAVVDFDPLESTSLDISSL